jgi:SAM-dependent methyltransferase
MSRAYFEARYLIPDPWRLATSPYERERARASLEALDGRRYARALEVGCGEGLFTARLLDRCDHIVAVDFSALALRRARRRFAGDRRVEVRRLDVRVEDLNQRFDLVVCAELLYYLNARELELVIEGLVRWVAPHGYLCLVHGTSVHDTAPGSGQERSGSRSAEVLHTRFSRIPDLAVLSDRVFPRYRVTLFRHRE